MKKFQEFRKTCEYRQNQQCTYWDQPTQCHLVACPLFSSKLPEKTKKIVRKQMKDSVIFEISDFDKTKTSVQDLIDEIRENNLLYSTNHLKNSKKSIDVEPTVQRMHCIACGEEIVDDKFVIVCDSNGVLIYIHSKGKCDTRKEGVPEVREKWLKSHTADS